MTTLSFSKFVAIRLDSVLGQGLAGQEFLGCLENRRRGGVRFQDSPFQTRHQVSVGREIVQCLVAAAFFLDGALRGHQFVILAAELLFHALQAAETLLQSGIRLLNPAQYRL